MKLFNWNTGLKPKFPAVVEKFLGKRTSSGTSDRDEVSIVPSINISDANKAFEVNVALPGLSKKDVKIEIQNDCLVISSEKKYENEDNQKDWIRREFGYASFQRMFQLPENADQEKVQAEMRNGVLSIKIAKKDGYTESKRLIAVE
ncbi:MAG: Hsp20/alpha crystallin family protein [Prolixibacteraceae bacterium]